MNKHILKVMRYLDNPELFSVEEMRENDAEAYAEAYASAYAACAYTANAKHWINEYFKFTDENKQDYTNEVERLK